MTKVIGRDDNIIRSLRREVTEIRDNILSSSFPLYASSFRSDDHTHDGTREDEDDDEDELQWAAIERLQTQGNQENFILGSTEEDEEEEETHDKKMKNDHVLGSAVERRAFIDKLLKKIEEDNQSLLLKQRRRIDRYVRT